MSAVELSSRDRACSPWLVLFQPTAAFRSVRERPRPWVTLLSLAVVAALPSIAFVIVGDMEAFLLGELKASGRLEEMPPSALAFVKDTLAPAMKVGVPAFTGLARLGSILVVATLAFALLRGLAKELSFKACLAAAALGAAPLVLHDVLSAGLVFTRDLSRLDVRNPVLSNPAAWFGLHVEKDPLGALLHGLDLFKLWAAWLSAYGINVVAGRTSILPYVLTYGGQVLATITAVIGAAASSAF